MNLLLRVILWIIALLAVIIILLSVDVGANAWVDLETTILVLTGLFMAPFKGVWCVLVLLLTGILTKYISSKQPKRRKR